ncbi:MAG: tRNA (adenosine(37)-N6)-dimethylallyltransferase MiaA [Saprospiraceae bacterium]|nr:tRNA (adenosine(37)-N6)-dimethylallyltransferase MiaA [Saprospiraceae bacterium]
MTKNNLIVISGPTASGKSDLAFRLAQHWQCPIISADSRQIYKELDIGTGKPTKDMLNAVEHHFIDHIEPENNYSVGTFEKEALFCLENLFKIHPCVIVCGGTGLYLKALLKGLDELPASDSDSKLRAQQLYAKEGLDGFLGLLQKIDPDYFDRVDRNNIRRISRALEVYFMTGRPFSYYVNKKSPIARFPFQEYCLMPDREWLYERINQRVNEMIQWGLLDEVQRLLPWKAYQALDTVGYKELFAFLEKKSSWEEAISLIKQHSRNYAKRQITWFRKESYASFVDPVNQDLFKRIAGS